MSALADQIIERLRLAGVSAIFGVPGGGGNLDLIEAARRAGLPFVLTATETAGAMAAIGQNEVTGKPGACLATLGPGAASLANGLACALLERARVIAFTDAAPTGPAGRFEHQQLDHLALLGPVTKWSGRIDSADPIAAVREAFRELALSPSGPVHLDCPGDIWSVPTSDEPSDGTQYRLQATDVHRALELASQARRPLVIAGIGAREPKVTTEIRRLCTDRGIPAMVTYKAKGVISDDNAWFGGVFTNGAIERPLVDASDVIIGIGLDPVELLPRPWIGSAPTIGFDRVRHSDAQIPFVAQVIDGDIAELRARMNHSTWDPEQIRADVDRQRNDIRTSGSALTPDRVVRTAAARFAEDARVTIDAGAHMFPATMLWPVTEPGRFLISNGLSTMGFALPAAIGAAIADRSTPVVALTGDGGLMMCAGELATAVRERLRIIVVVFNDASLSLIDIKQQARQLPSQGVALGSIDWTRIAAGFGVTPFSAATEAELEEALERASECDGPSLVDVRVDKSSYAHILKRIRG